MAYIKITTLEIPVENQSACPVHSWLMKEHKRAGNLTLVIYFDKSVVLKLHEGTHTV